MLKRFGCIVAVAFLINGCVSGHPGNREVIGSLAGAAGGAAIAANNIKNGIGRGVGIAAGALLGGSLGADIGRSLDRANTAYNTLNQQLQSHSQQVPVAGFAPPANIGSTWVDNGYKNSNTPTPYSVRDARSCRPLEGGFRQTFVCQNSIGQWFILQ